MRVLIDTNTFISYLLLASPQPDNTVGRLIEAAIIGEFELLLPEELLAELTRKLRTSPRIARRVSADDGQRFMAILRSIALIPARIEEPIPPVVRDPNDDYLLAHALLADADVIVSRDKDLLSLGQVGRIRMVSPYHTDLGGKPALWAGG